MSLNLDPHVGRNTMQLHRGPTRRFRRTNGASRCVRSTEIAETLKGGGLAFEGGCLLERHSELNCDVALLAR